MEEKRRDLRDSIILMRQLVYELQKGVRDLALFTCNVTEIDKIENELTKNKITYLTHHLKEEKVNIFLGQKVCLDILKMFKTLNLSALSPEEDFILGIMLGYSRKLEYLRYLDFKDNVTRA